MKIGKYNKVKWVFTDLTEELAYLIGVYLGDGFVSSRGSITPGTGLRFGLRSIDRDFVEYVCACIYKVFGDIVPLRVSIESYTYKNKTRQCTLYVVDYCKNAFCNWLLAISPDKKHIPSIIPRKKTNVTKYFLEGLLDSEGWVSIRKKRANSLSQNFQIGIAAKDPWILEAKDLYQKFGVKIGKTYEGMKKNTYIYQYQFNVQSFASSDLMFHISRKQKKVEIFRRTQSDPLRDCALSGCFSSSNDTVRPA